MSNRSVATGVFRAWGVMWWIYILLGLPQLLNGLFRHPYGPDQRAMEQFALSSSAISIGCQIVIAAFLMSKSGWLAEVVFPVEQELHLTMSAEAFRAVLFSAVGLYFLLDGIRHIVGNGYQLLARPHGTDQTGFGYSWQRVPEALATAVGGALAGAWVLFSRGRSPWKAAVSLYRKVFGLSGSANES
jgi:hypothetical protein